MYTGYLKSKRLCFTISIISTDCILYTVIHNRIKRFLFSKKKRFKPTQIFYVQLSVRAPRYYCHTKYVGIISVNLIVIFLYFRVFNRTSLFHQQASTEFVAQSYNETHSKKEKKNNFFPKKNQIELNSIDSL